MINEATKGTSAWEAQNSTLDAQKQKYIELKELSDSGALDKIVLHDDGTGIYTIHFEEDASQAQEAIKSFMLDTNELLTKYKDDENAY